MITVEKFNILIEDYLKKNYQPIIYKKHFTYYKLILEEMMMLFSENNNLHNHHMTSKVINHQNLRPFHVKLKDGEFTFRYDKYKKIYKKTTRTKFLNGIHDYECQDIPVLNIVIKDLITLGILVKVKGKQPIFIAETKAEDSNFTPAYYTLNFNPTVSNLYSNDEVIFEYEGDFKINYKSKFHFRLNDLMHLSCQSSISPRSFLRNYFLLSKMNEEAYNIKNIEDVGRVHNSLTQSNENFRSIVKTKDGEDMMSYDIKSSHPYFLAELTHSRVLYNDIKSGKYVDIFKKKRVLTWLNSSNYKSTKYNKENQIFLMRYAIDTSLYRFENSMYKVLAKLESDYVQAISKRLSVDNFTVHDQVYFPISAEEEFLAIVTEENKKLKYNPLWKRKV